MYTARLDIKPRAEKEWYGVKVHYSTRLTANINLGNEVHPSARQGVKNRINGRGFAIEEYLASFENLHLDSKKNAYIPQNGCPVPSLSVRVRPHLFGLGVTVIAEGRGICAIEDLLSIDSFERFLRLGECPNKEGGEP